ncbi:hypothetical protein GCM10028862_20880 [Luteimonas pelagia]
MNRPARPACAARRRDASFPGTRRLEGGRDPDRLPWTRPADAAPGAAPIFRSHVPDVPSAHARMLA